MSASPQIVPVLLSGGSGSRLWPVSREAYPKQLLPLTGENTMFQLTAMRTMDRAQFAAPLVIANHEHRFIIAEQLRALGIHDGRIILELKGRNTAPAAAVAALAALEADADASILIMPADHSIRDVARFRETIAKGAQAVSQGWFVLFGIDPTGPATGYGYIQRGPAVEGLPELHKVTAFVEKPSVNVARGYVASGSYFWNSGIFLLPAQALIAEFERLHPELLACARCALAQAQHDMDFLRLDPHVFAQCPSISIDHAIMERTERAAVIPSAFGWTDVGSWSTLWQIGEKDHAENVMIGDVVADDVKSCYLRSEGAIIAALGVEDLVVVATNDVILVAHRDRDQDVKRLVERLKKDGKQAAVQPVQVHRPWGYYQSIHNGDRFQVKRITVKPGAKLSLQKHFHRAEHWVVVNGTALVTRDGEQILLRENESIFLPLGCVHRLENPGCLPLNLIEVQSGPYLGEDDIIRIEDVYARK